LAQVFLLVPAMAQAVPLEKWVFFLPQVWSQEIDHITLYVRSVAMRRRDYVQDRVGALDSLLQSLRIDVASGSIDFRLLEVTELVLEANRMAVGFLHDRQHHKAIKLGEKCLEMLHVDGLDPPEFSFLRAISQMNLGKAYTKFRKFDLGRAVLERVTASIEGDLSSPMAQLVVAGAHGYLSELCVDEGKHAEAMSHATAEVSLLEKHLWTELTESRAEQAGVLATAYMKCGHCEVLGENFEIALAWFNKAAQSAELYLEETNRLRIELAETTALTQVMLDVRNEQKAEEAKANMEIARAAERLEHRFDYSQASGDRGVSEAAFEGFAAGAAVFKYDLAPRAKARFASSSTLPMDRVLHAAHRMIPPLGTIAGGVASSNAGLLSASRKSLFGRNAQYLGNIASCEVHGFLGAMQLVARMAEEGWRHLKVLTVCPHAAYVMAQAGVQCSVLAQAYIPGATLKRNFQLDFNGLLGAISALPPHSVLHLPLVHPVFRLDISEWTDLAAAMSLANVIPVLETSLAGFHDTIANATAPLRVLAHQCPGTVAVQSYEHLLPGDSVTVVHVVTPSDATKDRMERWMLSLEGRTQQLSSTAGKLVESVLADDQLFEAYKTALKDMGGILDRRRRSFVQRLSALKSYPSADPFKFPDAPQDIWTVVGDSQMHGGPAFWAPLVKDECDTISTQGVVRVPPTAFIDLQVLDTDADIDAAAEAIRDALRDLQQAQAA